MQLPAHVCHERLSAAQVGYLSTVGHDQVPHIVPITFCVVGDILYTAVDHKPKASTNLRRLRNIRENPRVSVLVDHYSDDWTQLWWVRADGSATLGDDTDTLDDAREVLAAKYDQYRERQPQGPVIAVSVGRLTGWAAGSA